ncbi:hypothetical protein [Swaminathania salitolerans]|nr:hypothetical protein [Swaminathania salitolerans]
MSGVKAKRPTPIDMASETMLAVSTERPSRVWSDRIWSERF